MMKSLPDLCRVLLTPLSPCLSACFRSPITSRLAVVSSVAFAAAGVANAADGKSSGGLPQLDATTYAPQLIWLVIIFGIFYLLLVRQLLPNIGRTIEARQARISRDLQNARRDHEEAEKLRAQQDARLESARLLAQKTLNQAVQKNQTEAAQILETAGQQHAKTVETELKKLEDARAQLLDELENSATGLAQQIVDGLGLTPLSEMAAHRAVADIISENPQLGKGA